jgi:hypothetical protein
MAAPQFNVSAIGINLFSLSLSHSLLSSSHPNIGSAGQSFNRHIFQETL